MAQTTALAAGTTAANSSDIVVAAGGMTISLFSGESDKSFERVKMPIQIKLGSDYYPYTKKQTNRAKRFFPSLSNVQRPIYIEEPGPFRVVRSAQTKSVGVMTDDNV